MQWIKKFEDLIDFLSLVIVHAPDDFPQEDYLRADEQLTLVKAFDELQGSMPLIKSRISDKQMFDQLAQTLKDSFAQYQAGNDVAGAHLLQHFESLLLKAIQA